MKAMTMTMPLTIMVVMMMVVLGTVEGGWVRSRRRGPGCRRAAGQGIMEEGPGERYLWTQSGLDEDDLRVTYQEGAFVPEGASVVFMYPRDRGQRALGLLPAKLFYDFTDADNPRIAIRKARHGRGLCVVMNSDVISYDDMRTQLLQRNVTNREVVEEEDARHLALSRVSDPTQFSEVLREMCSQDQCGNPVDAIYFFAEETSVSTDEEEEELEEEADDQGAMFDHSFMLFNDRVVISEFPSGRQWRRGMGPMGPMRSAMGSRAQRRLLRRQQRRQLRRQGRRERRRQRGRAAQEM